MKSWIRNVGVVVGWLAVGIVLSGCSLSADGKEDKNKDKEKKKEKPVPVEVVEIERGRIEGRIISSTDLEAEAEVSVFSKTSNFVKDLLVEEGDRVDKGDLLLRLQNDEQSLQFDRAQSQYENGVREFERQKRLYDDKLISDKDYNDAQYNLRQLEISMEQAKNQLDYTEVLAPISGTIVRRLVNQGDHITTNAHLYDIIDFNSIVARIYVPEKHLSQLELNQFARVYAPSLGEEAVEGHVKRIAPIVDAQTGTVKVTIGFEDVGQLRPGMYVNVELVVYVNPSAILVPKESLVYDADQIFVFRLIPGLEPPERKVERLLVKPRLMDKMFMEPEGQIEVGDRLVATGKIGLKDNALVRLPGDPEPKDEDEDEDEDKDEKEQESTDADLSEDSEAEPEDAGSEEK